MHSIGCPCGQGRLTRLLKPVPLDEFRAMDRSRRRKLLVKMNEDT